MKTINIVTNLDHPVSYLLQRMYSTEQKLQTRLSKWPYEVTSTEIREEFLSYRDVCSKNIHRLEKIFESLTEDPSACRADTFHGIVSEMEKLSATAKHHLKDIVYVSCVESINSYKISAYKTLYLFSIEDGIDSVTDLVQQILESELAVRKNISRLAIDEFNRTTV